MLLPLSLSANQLKIFRITLQQKSLPLIIIHRIWRKLRTKALSGHPRTFRTVARLKLELSPPDSFPKHVLGPRWTPGSRNVSCHCRRWPVREAPSSSLKHGNRLPRGRLRRGHPAPVVSGYQIRPLTVLWNPVICRVNNPDPRVIPQLGDRKSVV